MRSEAPAAGAASTPPDEAQTSADVFSGLLVTDSSGAHAAQIISRNHCAPCSLIVRLQGAFPRRSAARPIPRQSSPGYRGGHSSLSPKSFAGLVRIMSAMSLGATPNSSRQKMNCRRPSTGRGWSS